MKLLFTFLLTLIGVGAFAQYSIYETFEYPYDSYRPSFYIDTVNCTNNLWQIGKPQKVVFDSAYSYPNAIVTDTLNYYPPNDTSIFYLRAGGMYHGLLSIVFRYKLNIDSLSMARFEVSGDLGVNWINPMSEDTTYMFHWGGSKPRLDTSTDAWQIFDLNMDTWSYSSPGGSDTFPHYRTSDTILYRFTFVSGSDTVQKDGWIIDNFTSENTGTVGIASHTPGRTLGIWPNPSHGDICLHPNFIAQEGDRIVVYDMNGLQVYTAPTSPAMTFHLPLADGLYVLRYSGVSKVLTERLAIIR